jgi:putative methionine-R-sulfoxide reductase with GAF domain
VTPLAQSLRQTAAHLEPHRPALAEAWMRGLGEVPAGLGPDVRGFCTRQVDGLLDRLSRGALEELLQEEAREAAEIVRAGGSLHPLALAYALFDRCCLPFLAAACAAKDDLAECLLALDDLQARRLDVLLRAQEEESGRRLLEAQEQGARAADRARELAQANEALRRSEARSHHRAEQIGLLGSVAHRIAAILDPERLMQEAAETIQARQNHTYVAVVVLDDEGVLVGRWAGRPGVGRRNSGRAQGPAGGVIGRALRKRAPQVVADVSRDHDYHPDVPGTHSEMVIPLLDGGDVVGALDFQADRPNAFDLDDVAVGETLAEFLVVALRNARLFAEARGRSSA